MSRNCIWSDAPIPSHACRTHYGFLVIGPLIAGCSYAFLLCWNIKWNMIQIMEVLPILTLYSLFFITLRTKEGNHKWTEFFNQKKFCKQILQRSAICDKKPVRSLSAFLSSLVLNCDAGWKQPPPPHPIWLVHLSVKLLKSYFPVFTCSEQQRRNAWAVDHCNGCSPYPLPSWTYWILRKLLSRQRLENFCCFFIQLCKLIYVVCRMCPCGYS